MKVVKIKKSDLNLTLEDLLTKLKLVQGEQAFPERLYMSKEDEKVLRKNIIKKFKKEYPGLNNRALMSSVGMYFLNLGPSTLLSNAIKPGYVVISEEGDTP